MSAVVLSFSALKLLRKLTNKEMNAEEQTSIEKKKSLIAEGQEIFRFDTFGDEDFWSGLLHIDKAIAGANNGGFGPGVSPNTALAVGLKVDVDALPPDCSCRNYFRCNNLNDPATTLALLKLNAVVGVKGNFNAGEGITINRHYLCLLSFYSR